MVCTGVPPVVRGFYHYRYRDIKLILSASIKNTVLKTPVTTTLRDLFRFTSPKEL